ncbi:MAG TPA: VCBS repeat-containing protein, partial [Methylomirabilota bacterium]|nr:VCBS repeat-containing protein [Methylomirabilota bacterium]
PYELRDAGKREALTFGNRLFFGHRHSGYQQSPLGAQLARTGWSWGSAAADFDFDGFADVYIANGHETKASVEDYEPEFWLHDIYVGKSQENALAHQYFQEKFRATRGRGHSYGGYERNRFFLNEGGTNFVEVGYLFGLAMQEDSRNVAAADLTGDGKLDLIVTTFEVHPKIRQTIRIFENRLADVGAAVTLRLNSSKHWGQVGRLQNTATIQAFALPLGEGYRTQMEPVTRIGLGTNREIPIHLQIGGLTTNISPHGHKPVTIP